MNNKRQYCPICFRPMVVDESDPDIYRCFKIHVHGWGVWIDLNKERQNKRMENRFRQNQEKNNV